MTPTQNPTNAEIVKAYEIEYSWCKPHWIGGVPTDGDLRATRQATARKLRIPVISVAEALRDEGAKV